MGLSSATLAVATRPGAAGSVVQARAGTISVADVIRAGIPIIALGIERTTGYLTGAGPIMGVPVRRPVRIKGRVSPGIEIHVRREHDAVKAATTGLARVRTSQT